VIVNNDKKESVLKEIRRIFGQIKEPLKNQPLNFPFFNPQDAGPISPPQRYRKFTISYSNAMRSGVLRKSEHQTSTIHNQKSTTGTVSMETLTQESESSNSRQVSWAKTSATPAD
jgi:hypothetical protein